MKLKRELSLLRRQEVKHCVLDDSFGRTARSTKSTQRVYFHFYFHFNFRNFSF